MGNGRSSTSITDLLDPGSFLGSMLREYVKHKFAQTPLLYRATVLEIDEEGGQLQKNPPNPPLSIKARIITNSLDAVIPNEKLTIYWPFFSEHFSLPIKTGEQVFVIFEKDDFEQGFWITRTPEAQNHSNFNYSDQSEKYKIDESSSPGATFGVVREGRKTQNDILDIKNGSNSEIKENSSFVKENIKKLKKKGSDVVFHGSHNATIILSNKQDPNTANIQIIVGRKEEQPSFDADKVTIFLDEKDGKVSIHADKIEFLARDSVNIKTENGQNEMQKMLLSEDFLNEFNSFLTNLTTFIQTPKQVVVAGTAGTTIISFPEINFNIQLQQLKAKLNSLLSLKNKNN